MMYLMKNIFLLLKYYLPFTKQRKIYKYKYGVGDSFENTYKSLKSNYIWMMKVSEFNERFDSTINSDYEKDKRTFQISWIITR